MMTEDSESSDKRICVWELTVEGENPRYIRDREKMFEFVKYHWQTELSKTDGLKFGSPDELAGQADIRQLTGKVVVMTVVEYERKSRES